MTDTAATESGISTSFADFGLHPDILKAIADTVVDHGLQKFHLYRSSSTLLNVETLEVVRFGSCFEDISYVLKRHFNLDLAPRPTTSRGLGRPDAGETTQEPPP